MKLISKKSFSLIELITSIFIISLISIYAMIFYKESFSIHKNSFEKEKIKLEFLNTKLFLEKRKEFHKLSFQDNNLYFDNSLLLKNLSKYKFYENSNYVQIDICIENSLCQEIVVVK